MINVNGDRVEIFNNDDLVIEMFFIADEFVWIINSNNIVIDKDNEFYNYISRIMNNNYVFQSGIPSMKSDFVLVWLSDQYCDIENSDELDRINRLVIEKYEDYFIIRVVNPFLEKMNINRKNYMISFSPLFNGYFSKNVDSGLSLQDDFCIMYQNIRNKGRVLK